MPVRTQTQQHHKQSGPSCATTSRRMAKAISLPTGRSNMSDPDMKLIQMTQQEIDQILEGLTFLDKVKYSESYRLFKSTHDKSVVERLMDRREKLDSLMTRLSGDPSNGLWVLSHTYETEKRLIEYEEPEKMS